MDNVLKFLSELTYMLDENEANQLTQSIVEETNKNGIAEALHAVLTDLDPEKCWLTINLDWRDYEEFEWQAKAIAKTYGIKESFEWNGSAQLGDTAFIIYDKWLKQYNFNLIAWNKEDDSHNFFISKTERTHDFIEAAKKNNLDCYQYRADYSNLDGFIVEEVFDKNIELSKQITDKTQSALSQDLKPYVYLMTTWCEPCRELSQDFKHPAMATVLEGSYLLMIDFDIWISQIESVNLHSVKSVPTFAELDNKGILSGRFGKSSEEEFPDIESRANYWMDFFKQ